MIVGLPHLIDLEPELRRLVDTLPRGVQARRDEPGCEWHYEPYSPE